MDKKRLFLHLEVDSKHNSTHRKKESHVLKNLRVWTKTCDQVIQQTQSNRKDRKKKKKKKKKYLKFNENSQTE